MVPGGIGLNLCEEARKQEIKLVLDRKTLENKLLAKQIELLEKSPEYRCRPAGEAEEEEGEGRSSASSSFPRLVFGRFSPSCYRGAAQRSAGGEGEVDIHYPDEFIDRLHLLWGDALLPPGGPDAEIGRAWSR